MLGFVYALSQGGVLAEMAEKNPNVVVVSQDMGPLSPFSDKFPDRFFDVGISEGNLIGVAAGLAHAGKMPFVVGMAPFVSMRSFEQIRTDCSYNRNGIKIIAPCSGLEGGHWGATHHAVEDLALLRLIPGMTVLCPGGSGRGHTCRKGGGRGGRSRVHPFRVHSADRGIRGGFRHREGPGVAGRVRRGHPGHRSQRDRGAQGP